MQRIGCFILNHGNKNTLKEAEELSRNYLEKGFVAVTEDGMGFYINYSELPDNPSKLIFFHERYLTHMIEWYEDSAEVTKFEQYREPKDIQTLERNLQDIAEGIYGRPPVEYSKHAGTDYIDLGLPSGLRWARFPLMSNYAWGEVAAGLCGTTKKDIERKTGMADIKPAHETDAVRRKLDGKWRMPTAADFQELVDTCQWQWRKYGYLITGPNGNRLFLLARILTGEHNDKYVGEFWTASSEPGKEMVKAVFIGENEYSIRDASMMNYMEHWPVFSENDHETQKDSKVITVKRGSVKLDDYCRMQYRITEDKVIYVKGDLGCYREGWDSFPVKQDWDKPYSHLVVEEGVSVIGRHMFYRAPFHTAKLPSTLLEIGAGAFDGNDNLEHILFNVGLKRIGADAFRGCRRLKAVELPEGFEEICEDAFLGTAIKEVYVPKTVKKLHPNAFDKSTRVIYLEKD